MENFHVLNTLPLRRLRYDQNPGLDGALDELFPAGVAVLPNLKLINLGGTSFTGTIPAGAFAGARSSHFNQAKFTGLPAVAVLNGSSEVRIAGNRLSGVVPAWLLDPPAGAIVRLSYNLLDIANTPPGALDTIDPGWRATQTVPPAVVQVIATTISSATLGWTPIAYTAHGGHYEVLASETAGGPTPPSAPPPRVAARPPPVSPSRVSTPVAPTISSSAPSPPPTPAARPAIPTTSPTTPATSPAP